MGRPDPVATDVVEAARGGEGLGLDALAQLVAAPVPEHGLVLQEGVRADLELLLLRCRGRDRLVEGLGQAARTRFHPGVKALMVGPSVTSKNIGEPEKNLSDLMARAEQAEVVLLFDEADSLFGKRTEVKEANDRFANAQTNYLLQRIETYDGIVLLTSNSRERFDSAFNRRLDAIVDFALPGPRERHALWLAHLGEGQGLSEAELNRLAGVVDVAGGAIRNVVLAAAVLAREAGRPITLADVRRGLEAEYRKLSQSLPQELGEA
jgi:AAA+ superfamily predicted ATPase